MCLSSSTLSDSTLRQPDRTSPGGEEGLFRPTDRDGPGTPDHVPKAFGLQRERRCLGGVAAAKAGKGVHEVAPSLECMAYIYIYIYIEGSKYLFRRHLDPPNPPQTPYRWHILYALPAH